MATVERVYAPLRAPLPRAPHLPGYFYISPEIYEGEKAKIAGGNAARVYHFD